MNCPSCSEVIPADAPLGLCLACLVLGSINEPPAAGLFAIRNHTVEKVLGEGGMGRVYLATQLTPSRTVALKMLSAQHAYSPEMQRRFHNEAEAIASLDHAHILPIYEVGEHDGLPYFTMKLADGGTLAAKRAALLGEWKQIAQIMQEVAQAVHFAHSRGILHRDLKPGNILFDSTGQTYVADFGLAKLSQSAEPNDQTKSFQLLGTPAYLAPEIASGSLKAASVSSDVYALGAILYELLAGQLPHEKDSMGSLLTSIIQDDPSPLLRINSAIPKELAAIAHYCLQKAPAARYRSADQFALDLHAWSAGEPISVQLPSLWQQGVHWVKKHPASASLIGVLIFGSVLGLLGLNQHNQLLTGELGNTQRERRDAEGLLEFMNVDLTFKLKEVGKLDVLETVNSKSRDYFKLRQQRALASGRKEDRVSNLQSRIYSNQAEIAYEQANFSAALELAEEALALHPTDEAKLCAKYWKGRTLIEIAPISLGQQLLLECLDAFPAVPEEHLTEPMLDLALNLADKLEAIHSKVPRDLEEKLLGFYDRILTKSAANTLFRYRGNAFKADLLRKLNGDTRPALDAWQAFETQLNLLLANDSTNARLLEERMLAWNHLGNLHLTLGASDTALAFFRRCEESARTLAAADRHNHRWRRERKLGLSSLFYTLIKKVDSPPDEMSGLLARHPEIKALTEEYVQLAKQDVNKTLSRREVDDGVRGLREVFMVCDPAASLEILSLFESYQWRWSQLSEGHAEWTAYTNLVHHWAKKLEEGNKKAEALFDLRKPGGGLWADEAQASLLALKGGYLRRVDDILGSLLCLQQAQAIRERLVRDHPNDLHVQEKLAALYWHVAETEGKLKRLNPHATWEHWQSNLSLPALLRGGVSVGKKTRAAGLEGVAPLLTAIPKLVASEDVKALREAWLAPSPPTLHPHSK